MIEFSSRAGGRVPFHMTHRDNAVLVVIDAQRAFVDHEGTLMRTLGAPEVRPGVEAFARLCEYLRGDGSDRPAIFVRSEYTPGQFTEGRLDHPMADLCVPGRNVDCEWARGMNVGTRHAIVTKHQGDAWTADAFRAAVDRALVDGARRILLAGFQFTTCVTASALSLRAAVRERGVQVAVVEPLTGARTSSYVPDRSGVSRIELTRRRLTAAGVGIVATAE